MKKIPIKNYIYAFLIVVVTLLLVFQLINIYINNSKLTFITEVQEEELNQFITEKNDIFIYFSKNNNKTIEKELEKYLKNNEIRNDIIYIDLNKVSKDFETKFNNQFVEVTSSIRYSIKNPTLVSIQNGKIASCLNNIDSIDDIKRFIEGYIE